MNRRTIITPGNFSQLKYTLLTLVLIAFSYISASAQDTESGKKKETDKTEAAKDSTKQKEKGFTDFITEEAISSEGMLTVHKVKDKYYFELPDSIFQRDIIAVTRIAKTPTGAGYGGEQANRQVVRFEKGPNKKVFLRVITFVNVAEDTTQMIHTAVSNSNMQPIIAAFDVKAVRKDTSVLIEVSGFFNKPNQAFDLPPITKQQYKIKSIADDRSYIESIRAYPINVEVRSIRTYEVNPPSLTPSKGPAVDLNAGVNAGAVTYELNTSMVLLPKEPMKRRFFDQRVGIFSNSYTVYSDESHKAEPQIFTVRWRMEPKNEQDARRQKNGEMIEPQKPIIFYIDPATPHL